MGRYGHLKFQQKVAIMASNSVTMSFLLYHYLLYMCGTWYFGVIWNEIFYFLFISRCKVDDLFSSPHFLFLSNKFILIYFLPVHMKLSGHFLSLFVLFSRINKLLTE